MPSVLEPAQGDQEPKTGLPLLSREGCPGDASGPKWVLAAELGCLYQQRWVAGCPSVGTVASHLVGEGCEVAPPYR